MSNGLLTALGAVTNALFLIGGVYIYISLVRQIAARASDDVPSPDERTFAWPEALVAFLLASLFLSNLALASTHKGKLELGTNDLIANGLLALAIFLFIAAFLKLRGFNVTALAGLLRFGFWRTLMTAGVLLFAAYPLIFVADLLTQRVLGGDSSRQDIVALFNESQTLRQRVMIIVLAVAIAPMVEEFVFRFFLYGVLRRYAGRFAGLIVSAGLFAAVHAHLPSAGPLFVLAACLTLAYEWSGSIVVTMTMHALFNALTLTALAFPSALGE